TGESLGETASQTPMNIYVMKEAIGDFLIIQPLIALFKLEIEKIAKKIGTYKASIQRTYTCTANPKYPVTYANLDKIKEIEEKNNIKDLIQQSLKSAKILYF
ncbi:MAG: tRNA 4-thiouridine(8) synthase ThiI, partial [Candidatus Hodarchaeota archaeon]